MKPMTNNLTVPEAAVNESRNFSESRYLRSKRKRAVDVSFGIFGLIVTAAIFPFIALLIKLDSSGPILYYQKRLGIGGKNILVFKFRTMVNDAEAGVGATWASKDDPRMTRIGRILRKLYIDELPQWWNVTTGDMSVVGPRPERPEMTIEITERYPNFPRRLIAKPGITGLAQTEFMYTNTVEDSRHKLNYDRRYIENASFLLDAWVIVRTFRRILLRSGT